MQKKLLKIGVLTFSVIPIITTIACNEPKNKDSSTNLKIQATKISDLNLPKSNAKVLASSIKKPNNGITFSGVSYQFTKWTSNNKDGTIKWKVTLSLKNSKNRILSNTINGFLTKSQLVQKINAKIHAKTQLRTKPKIKLGANSKTASEVTTSDIKIPNLIDNDLKARIIDVSLPTTTHDGTTVIVKIKIFSNVDGTIAKTYKVELNRFKSLLQVKLQKRIFDAKKEIDLNLPMSNSQIFASASEKYQYSPDDGTTSSGVDYSFTKWDIKEDGTIKWEVTLSLENADDRKFIGTITGFQTLINKEKSDSAKILAIKASDLNLPEADSKVLATSINKPDDNQTSSGVSYKFTKWEVKFATIKWEVVLNFDYGIEKSLSGKIIGFLQTEDSKAVENDKIKFANFNQNLIDNPILIEEEEIVEATILEDLNGHNNMPESTLGVTRTFEVEKIYNYWGIVLVKVHFIKGDARNFTTYKIIGFKKNARDELLENDNLKTNVMPISDEDDVLLTSTSYNRLYNELQKNQVGLVIIANGKAYIEKVLAKFKETVYDIIQKSQQFKMKFYHHKFFGKWMKNFKLKNENFWRHGTSESKNYGDYYPIYYINHQFAQLGVSNHQINPQEIYEITYDHLS